MRSVALLMLLAGAAVSRPPASDRGHPHDGEFSSARKWFLTSLVVIEDREQALVSYHGAFGPGCAAADGAGWCRSCSFGPALVRAEGPERFVYRDDQGVVRLALLKGAWQLALTEGSFSGCGAGWTHDEFGRLPLPPTSCEVVTAEAQLRLPRRAADGSQDEIVAAGDVLGKGAAVVATGLEEPEMNRNYVLVRAGESIGLLPVSDVRCGGQPEKQRRRRPRT